MSLSRSPMPPRTQQLARTGALTRTTVMARGGTLTRRTPIRQVSAKRAAENRARRAMVAAMFPDRPLCVVYALSWDNPGLIPDKVILGCGRWADDVHEPLSRARLGSITDPGNAVAPCRPCHDVITFRPESELGWAYDLGLLKHSRNAASEGGGAA